MSAPTITRYLPSYLDTNVHPGIWIPIDAMDTCIQNLMRQAGSSNRADVDRNLTGRDIVTLIDGVYDFGLLSDAKSHANTVEAISTNMNSQGFEIEKWPLKKLENFLFEMVTHLTNAETKSYRQNANYIRKQKVFIDDPAKFIKYFEENDPTNLEAANYYLENENARFVNEMGSSLSCDLINESKVLSPASKEFLRKYFYFCPMPQVLQKSMQTFFAQLQGKLRAKQDPIEIAAFVHMQIVRIHPFDNGNGRVARLFMNLILKRFDLQPVYFFSEKEYLKAVGDCSLA